MLCHAVCRNLIIDSTQRAEETGGSRFLQNGGKHLPYYEVSHPISSILHSHCCEKLSSQMELLFVSNTGQICPNNWHFQMFCKGKKFNNS